MTTTTSGIVVAGVNLVAGVEIPAILAGWISNTELHESGSGGPRLVAGVEFSTRRHDSFMILPLRNAPDVKSTWQDLENRIAGF